MNKSISDAVALYLDFLSKKNASPHTISRYKRTLNRFASSLQKVGILSLIHLQKKNLMALQISGLCEASLLPITKHHNLAVLKSWLNFLFNQGLITLNLSKMIPIIKIPVLTLPKNILSRFELLKLFSLCDMSTHIGFRDRTILELAYSSALRRAELVSLHVNHINLPQKTLLVSCGKGQKDRVVPLCETSASFLKEFIFDIRDYFKNASSSPWLFLSDRGNKLSIHTLNQLVRAYGKKAGLSKKITPHLLRHTCATHLMQNGLPINLLQLFLGHESSSSTSRYLHLSIHYLKKQYARFHPRA